MTTSGQLAPHFRRAAFIPLFFLGVLALLCLGILLRTVFAEPNSPAAQQSTASGPAPGQSLGDYVTTHIKEADTNIERETDTLEKRSTAQQNLITGLTGLTSLYVVILSLAAYFRLKATERESEKSVKSTEKKTNESIQSTKKKMQEFIQEVRADIPAVHGIGRRLEELLAYLDTRMSALDWTRGSTFKRLDDDQLQQALIDEMVVNSLDIFNVKEDLTSRRSVARLYHRLGQFYLGRANFLRATELAALGPVAARPQRVPGANLDDSVACLCRAKLYLDKAVAVDERNAVILRVRGVIPQYVALWKKEDTSAAKYVPEILSESRTFIDRALTLNPNEPGALFASAWLLANSDPPRTDDAVKELSKLIKYSPMLDRDAQTKYLYPAYLNRADYNARLAKAASGSTQQSLFTDIVSDLNDAFATAKKYSFADECKSDIHSEIEPHGDLEHAYETSADVKAAIDNILI